MLSLEPLLSSYWAPFANGLLKDAILITDGPMLNSLKWNFPLDFLSSVRIVGVLEDYPNLDSQKIIFLLSSSILPVWSTIQALLEEPFQQVYVYTSILHASHLHELQKRHHSMESDPENAYFLELEAWILERLYSHAARLKMDLELERIVKVSHVPLHFALICSQVFMFPRLISMVPHLNQKVDESSLPLKLVETVAGVQSQELHSSLDVLELAHALSSLLESLGFKDELFVLGETAKKVAKSIVSQSNFALRRNSESQLAVILMDRTMDLESCFVSNDTILDILYNSRPRNHSSLDILLSPLLLMESCSLDTSLAHGGEESCKDLLQVLSCLDYKNALITVRKRILEILQSEIPTFQPPRILGRVTKSQLETLFKEFHNKWDIIEKRWNILSCLSGIVESMDSESVMRNMKLMEIEKGFHDSNESEVVQQIQSLLSKVGLEFELQDVLMTSVYASLIGFELSSLKLDFKETLSRLSWDPVSSDLWIQSNFALFHNLYSFAEKKRPGKSLISQIVSLEVLGSNSHRSQYLTHVPYTGTIGSVISGLNRFLGGDVVVPSQFENVLIFIIGGITWKEIGELKRLMPHCLIGSNQIVSRNVLYSYLERSSR